MAWGIQKVRGLESRTSESETRILGFYGLRCAPTDFPLSIAG